MATFKITVFKHQKRRDGKYPVSIRVGWKRKYSFIDTEDYMETECEDIINLKNNVDIQELEYYLTLKENTYDYTYS